MALPIQVPLLKPAPAPKSSETSKADHHSRGDGASDGPADEFDRALESAGQSNSGQDAADKSDSAEKAETTAQHADDENGKFVPATQEPTDTIDPSETLAIAAQFIVGDTSPLHFGIGQFSPAQIELSGVLSGKLNIASLQGGSQVIGVGLAASALPPGSQPNFLARLQGVIAQGGMPINTEAELLEQGALGLGTELGSLKSIDTASAHEADTDPQRALQTAVTDNKTTMPSVKAELSIPVKVGSEGWSDAMAGRINLLVNQKISSARIQVTPVDLGPIEVRVNINSDQASVQFTSASAQVRDALEQSIPRLREMLESAGFSLADSGVSDQGAQDQRGESGETDNAETEALDETSGVVAQRQTIGLVDDFV